MIEITEVVEEMKTTEGIAREDHTIAKIILDTTVLKAKSRMILFS